MTQGRIAMSLTALIDEEVVRARRILRSPTHHTAGLVAPRVRLGRFGFREPAQGELRDTTTSNALDSLSRYIPTEIVTLYVATLSAMAALMATLTLVTDVKLYWFFAVLTPVLLLLILAGKR
jgi:hypothetical protein